MRAGLILLLLTTSAAAFECHRRPEPGDRTWREIDGRRCWYQGSRRVAKSALHWAARDPEPPPPREPPPPPMPPPPTSGPIEPVSDFDQRFRGN